MAIYVATFPEAQIFSSTFILTFYNILLARFIKYSITKTAPTYTNVFMMSRYVIRSCLQWNTCYAAM